jgi:Spy/CpxP family protein refolding chaperone
MAAFLDLSEEQQAQIDAIHEQYQPQIQALVEQKRAARQGKFENCDPGNFDEAAARAAAEAQAELNVELRVLRAKLHAELYSVLTDEQKQQLADFRAKMKDRRGQRGRGKCS